MIICKCIKRIKDRYNRVYGYVLEDMYGNTQEINSEALKSAIRNRQIDVINLKLTSNGKLFYTKKPKISTLDNNIEPLKNSSKDNLIKQPRYSRLTDEEKEKHLVKLAKELISKTKLSNIVDIASDDVYWYFSVKLMTIETSIDIENGFNLEINFRDKRLELSNEDYFIGEDDSLYVERTIICKDLHIESINKACEVFEDCISGYFIIAKGKIE